MVLVTGAWTDLATWLGRVWDEREAAATNALKIGDEELAVSRGYTIRNTWSRELWRDGAFQSAWTAPGPSPQEVLAEVGADRAILAECSMVLEDKAPRRLGERILAWTVLRQLASVHRDLPGWREAWQ